MPGNRGGGRTASELKVSSARTYYDILREIQRRDLTKMRMRELTQAAAVVARYSGARDDGEVDGSVTVRIVRDDP
jgi:hypothetical protein